MTFSIFKRRESHDHDHDHEQSAKPDPNPSTSSLPRYSTNNSLSQPPPPYSPTPHTTIPSETHSSPAHLSELTIDYIPGTLFNAFKNTLLIYDSPRYPNTKPLPIFKMTIEGMKRITSMYIYSGSIKNEDSKEEVMLGGAQFDKLNRKIEVQQLGIEGVQRESESGVEHFGGGRGRENEGRYEWRFHEGHDEGKGNGKEEGKERVLVWQQKIPSATQKLSFSNPNAELRDKKSGDLYAVMMYDVFAGKDMMGIQYRGGISGGEKEKRGFQMGVLITGCVVVERERQRIGRRGTIGMGLGIGIASG